MLRYTCSSSIFFWGLVNTEWRKMKTDESTFYNSWSLELLAPVWVNYQKFSRRKQKTPQLFSGEVMWGCAEIDPEYRQSLGLPARKLGNWRDLLGSCTRHHLADSCHNVNRGQSNAMDVNRNTDWMRWQHKNMKKWFKTSRISKALLKVGRDSRVLPKSTTRRKRQMRNAKRQRAQTAVQVLVLICLQYRSSQAMTCHPLMDPYFLQTIYFLRLIETGEIWRPFYAFMNHLSFPCLPPSTNHGHDGHQDGHHGLIFGCMIVQELHQVDVALSLVRFGRMSRKVAAVR